MRLRAVIRDTFGGQIDNHMPFFGYNLVSETLQTTGKSTINPLRKYESELPFHIFLASCVHCLLIEISNKLDKPIQSLSIFDTISEHVQSVGTIGSHTKISSASAVEKFFRMIKNYSALNKGENYAEIMRALKRLIEELGSQIDDEPYVSECLDLISQLKTPGISIIEIAREEKTEEIHLASSAAKLALPEKQAPVNPRLKSLYKKYSITTDEPSAKLLRAIANQANLEDLAQLSEIVSIETIINAQSPSGKTALHWLVKGAQQVKDPINEERYRSAYQWLIEHGANSTLIDQEGKAALEYDDHHLFEKSAGHSASTSTLK